MLGRPGRGARRPLADHDVRQPRRRAVGDAARRVPHHGLRRGHGRADGRARHRARARRRLVDGRRDRAGARRSRIPGKVRSLVLNGTYCRGDHFFREVIRSWQWAAQKSDNLRDFLNVVNLWCFAPRIYNEGIMEEWLTAAAASPNAQSVDAFCRSADALIEHDTYDRVGAISVPTLVTVGELDLCLPGALRPRARRPASRARSCTVIARAGPPAVPGGAGGVQRAARGVLVVSVAAARGAWRTSDARTAHR